MTKLKLCPRCGGRPKETTNMWDAVIYPDETIEYTVMCEDCDHKVISDISMEDAEDLWNKRGKNAPGVYAAWIGCGLGVENSLIGLYDSYDKAYSTIINELEFECNRKAWLCIERWTLNSNDPSDIWEFSARKLWKSIEEAKECQ